MESWTSQPVRPSYGCSLWKAIRAGLDSFNRFVDFGVGDDRWIRFTHDGWDVDMNLASLNPQLFQKATNKDACYGVKLQRDT